MNNFYDIILIVISHNSGGKLWKEKKVRDYQILN